MIGYRRRGLVEIGFDQFYLSSSPEFEEIVSEISAHDRDPGAPLKELPHLSLGGPPSAEEDSGLSFNPQVD